MKYLYGDSHPFPEQYNFLASLEVFMTRATAAAQLQYEIQRALTKASLASQAREKSLGELEAIHQNVVQSLQTVSQRNLVGQVPEYVSQLITCGTGIIDESRRMHAQATERDANRIRTDSEKKRDEIRSQLEKFFVSARIPVTEAKITMTLDGGKHLVGAELTHPDRIETGFVLAAHEMTAWQVPRRVSEFANGLRWQVGMRKSWFKSSPQPEVVHLDDFYLGGFELAPEVAEIRLRKKPDVADSLVFRVARDHQGLVAEVERPGEENNDSLQDPNERAELEKLWMLIRAAISPALMHKEKLKSVRLDGVDVFETNRVLELIKRIVSMLAPTVSEIARRSPNSAELSLKSESDAGRREEIYLRKEELTNKLLPLSAEARAIFAPLALGDEVTSEIDFLVEE